MKKFIRYQIQKVRSWRQSVAGIFKKTQQLQFKLLTKKGTKIAKISPQIQIPKNRYVFIERYLQMFYNSTSQNGRANGQNLVFVVGAQGSGKTCLIKQSLQLFKKKKNVSNMKRNQKQLQFIATSTPQTLQDEQRSLKVDNQFHLIIQFNMNNHFMMKSQAFFHHIHQSIISQILKLSKQVKNITNITLLDANLVAEIVLAYNAHQYIFIFIKDLIFSILNTRSIITLSKQGLQKLEILNQRVIQISSQQFFYPSTDENDNTQNKLSFYQQLIFLLAEELNKSQLQASIMLFMNVFKTIQHQNRPQLFRNTYYETGIHTTTFLFAILNYLCGFGNLNKMILKQHINTQHITNNQQLNTTKNNSSKKSNHQLQSSVQRYQKYYVGRGNHIDVVLTFSHLQKLKCYKNPKFSQWFDNILIQLQNASNLRTHFPVVIQLSNSYELNVLQRLGRMQIDNPTIVQIPGYQKTNIFRYAPSMLFNPYTLNRLRPVLGRNQSTWNEAIFQLSKGVKLQDIILGTASFMDNKVFEIKFNNKINRMYLHAQNLPLIDNNTLKYHIIQYLTIFHKCNGFMKTLYMHINANIFSSKIIHQFEQQKLIYQAYYNSGIDLVDMRYLIQIRRYLQNIKYQEWMRYRWWRLFNSPYSYFYKQLRYRDDLQEQFYRRTLGGMPNQRSDYMIREYFGGLRDHKIIYYENILKDKYNV